MSAALNISVLFAGAVLMLLLPLLPALIEYRRKTDALPLRVIQDYGGEIRHFAQSFREFVQVLQAPLRECALQHSTASGQLRDGSEYILLGDENVPFFRRDELAQRLTERVIVCARSFDAPEKMVFTKEVHVHGTLNGAAGNVFRAVLGEKNVRLGAGSTILRWMHAAGAISAEANCTFHGRLSSDELIQLGPWCHFERVNAPCIEFGHGNREEPKVVPSNQSQLDAPVDRLLLKGDFDIPAGDVIHSSVVASGTIRVGRGARILGGLKSNHDLLIGDGAQLEGSAISARHMKIGRHCRVHGPVLAEHHLSIATGTYCGSRQQPTTVSAPTIRIQPGVVVFGTVWAKEHGGVKA
jgi:hypothetical protein